MDRGPDRLVDRRTAHLRAGGVSLLLDVSGDGVPGVLHWGADLGDDLPGVDAWGTPLPFNDAYVRPTLLGGGLRRPALRGSRASTGGRDWAPRWTLEQVDQNDQDGAGALLRCSSPASGLTLVTRLALDQHGVLTAGHELRNDGTEPYLLDRLAVVLPVPHRAAELLDLTGRWARERSPSGTPSTPRAPGCARRAPAGRATTRPCSWSPAPPASATGTARSGARTWRGAAAPSPTPSAAPTRPA